MSETTSHWPQISSEFITPSKKKKVQSSSHSEFHAAGWTSYGTKVATASSEMSISDTKVLPFSGTHQHEQLWCRSTNRVVDLSRSRIMWTFIVSCFVFVIRLKRQRSPGFSLLSSTNCLQPRPRVYLLFWTRNTASHVLSLLAPGRRSLIVWFSQGRYFVA